MRYLGRIIFGLALSAAAAGAFAAPQTEASSVQTVPQGGLAVPQLDGQDAADFAVSWWRWLMSAPDGRDIMADDSGALCALNQSGPVWYLAGSYDTGAVSRSCAVPAGKYLFVPVAQSMLWDSADGRDCHLLQADVKTVMDTAHELFLEVDGKSEAVQTSIRAAPKKCFTLPNETDIYATDGYWLLLKPLPKGQHIIRFGGKLGDGGINAEDSAQNIEYQLDVQ